MSAGVIARMCVRTSGGRSADERSIYGDEREPARWRSIAGRVIATAPSFSSVRYARVDGELSDRREQQRRPQPHPQRVERQVRLKRRGCQQPQQRQVRWRSALDELEPRTKPHLRQVAARSAPSGEIAPNVLGVATLTERGGERHCGAMNLRALVERIGLSKLNSLTKYPSILTYHALGDKGRLLPERNRTFAPGARVLVTEKVDGTNTRIVLLPATGEWLIGSREEWLHARGDLVASPALGIVEAVRATAERCANSLTDREGIVAIYGEVYGAKVTAASKQYTGGDPSLVGFRLFDAWSGSIDALVERVESSTPERLAAWREDCQQAWFDEDELRELSEKIQVEVAPRIEAKAPPEGVEETLAWLKETLPRTRVALSEGASGQPEGVVVRTPDRSVIAKIRFEDYERTVPREHAGRSR